jgi:hypothetical protein
MSVSGFIASLVGSLAWPAVVVVVLVIFRSQFATMLERLARVRAGPEQADSDWSRALAAVRQSQSAVRSQRPQQPNGSPRPGPVPGSEPQRADLTGSAALVDERWLGLERELREVVRPSGLLTPEQLAGAGFDDLLDAAVRSGLLTAATLRSLDGLRQLRNLARVSNSLTERQAEEFAVTADAVSYAIRQGVPG